MDNTSSVMKKILMTALIAAATLCTTAQEAYQPLRTTQVASYNIEAKLDTDAKMVSGV